MFPSSSNFEPRPSIFPQNKATQGKKLISIFLGFLGRCTVFFLLVCFFVLFRSTLFLNKILLNSLQPRRGLITFFSLLGFPFFPLVSDNVSLEEFLKSCRFYFYDLCRVVFSDDVLSSKIKKMPSLFFLWLNLVFCVYFSRDCFNCQLSLVSFFDFLAEFCLVSS